MRFNLIIYYLCILWAKILNILIYIIYNNWSDIRFNFEHVSFKQKYSNKSTVLEKKTTIIYTTEKFMNFNIFFLLIFILKTDNSTKIQNQQCQNKHNTSANSMLCLSYLYICLSVLVYPYRRANLLKDKYDTF